MAKREFDVSKQKRYFCYEILRPDGEFDKIRFMLYELWDGKDLGSKCFISETKTDFLLVSSDVRDTLRRGLESYAERFKLKSFKFMTRPNMGERNVAFPYLGGMVVVDDEKLSVTFTRP